jgi:chemotaxis protein MotB
MSKKGGHHGGAWKVAYADFVTAMMALFMVLWLSSQDPHIKEAVQRAFTNPFSSVTKDSVGIISSKEMQAVKSSTGNFDSASAIELSMLRRLNQDLIKSFQTDSDENPVKLDLTDDGLSINVFDRSHKPIFEPQSTNFTSYGDWVFSTLAWEISRYCGDSNSAAGQGFQIELAGHTEAGNPDVRDIRGDMKISSDRANAALGKLLEHGVDQNQIRRVTGYGDTVPMPGSDPADEINRRVTVFLSRAPSKI